MKNIALLLTLAVLPGCEYRRIGPARPAPETAKKPRYPVPEDLKAGIKRLATLYDSLQEMVQKDRLFEIHDSAEHVEDVARELPRLATRDLTNRTLDEITDVARKVIDTAGQLDHASASEKREETAALNEKLPDLVAALRRHENLSDEYEVKQVVPHSPVTYKGAISRINGIYGSIKEKIEKERLFEVHAPAENLRIVGENLVKLANNDIAFPIKGAVEKSVGDILKAAGKLHEGADHEKKDVASKALEEIKGPLDAIDQVYKRVTGHSALE